MNDLHDALRKAISDYMNVEELTPRQRARVRSIHDKFAYNYDTVDSLLVVGSEETADEDE